MKNEIKQIIDYSINQCKPDILLSKYLPQQKFNNGKLIVISLGKAGWTMGNAAQKYLKKKIDCGIILTKYHHALANIDNFTIYEAGHPITDNNGIIATEAIISLLKSLNGNDDVIFMISGGGSALLEQPIIPLSDLQQINKKLINGGASIDEINTIRKKLSNVKGGRLAFYTKASIYNYILSDVIGNDLSIIASGPTVESNNDINEAIRINQKYNLNISQQILSQPFPKLNNIHSILIGSNILLANSAKTICEKLNYNATIVNDHLCGNVEEFADELITLATNSQSSPCNKAFIFSGELTLEVKNIGLGGRNQHLIALCLESFINLNNISLFACGSDGTDGPTDADGAFCNHTIALNSLNYDIDKYVNNYDSYNLLKKLNALIFTGPTGTNVNDLIVLLVKKTSQ